MAVQAKPYVSLSKGGSLVFEVHMEYHDDDFQTVNDDGDDDDFRVIRWYGTNHSARDLNVLMKRGNGQAWVDRTIVAGSTFTQNAGGAVKYETDVPVWSIG